MFLCTTMATVFVLGALASFLPATAGDTGNCNIRLRHCNTVGNKIPAVEAHNISVGPSVRYHYPLCTLCIWTCNIECAWWLADLLQSANGEWAAKVIRSHISIPHSTLNNIAVQIETGLTDNEKYAWEHLLGQALRSKCALHAPCTRGKSSEPLTHHHPLPISVVWLLHSRINFFCNSFRQCTCGGDYGKIC